MPYLTNDGVRAADLARIHRMPIPSMAKLIKEVELQSYIYRQTDPVDCRATRLFATDKTLQLARDALQINHELALGCQKTLGQDHFQLLLHHASRLWYLLGGTGPEQNQANTLEDKSFDALLEHWVDLLPSLLEQHSEINLQDVFHQQGGKRQLRTQFIERLCNLNILT